LSDFSLLCLAIDSEFCFHISLTFIMLFYHWIVAGLWNKTVSYWQKRDRVGIFFSKKGKRTSQMQSSVSLHITILIFFIQSMQLDFNGRVIQLETNTAAEFRSDEESMVYYHHMAKASNLELSKPYSAKLSGLREHFKIHNSCLTIK